MNQPLRQTTTNTAADSAVLLELCFPATADRLKLIRPSIHAAALMCGFPELDARDIVLAVDEACQNIIVHAYTAAEGVAERQDIAVTVFQRNNGIQIRLRDFATPVDPATIKPRDLAAVRPGGLGTHFIRQIMDRVEYLPGTTGNTVELLKHHRPAP